MMPRRGPALVPFAVPGAPPRGLVAPEVKPFAPVPTPDGTPLMAVPDPPATRPLRMLAPAAPFAVWPSAPVVASEPFVAPPLRTPMPEVTDVPPLRAPLL